MERLRIVRVLLATAWLGASAVVAAEIPLWVKQQLASNNPREAVGWLASAANAGDSEAAFKLGKMYYLGVAVAKNRSQAEHFLHISAEAGEPNAMYLLSKLLQKSGNATAATRWLQNAADAGHANSIADLSRIQSARPESSLFEKIDADIEPPTAIQPVALDGTNAQGQTPLIHAVRAHSTAWALRLVDAGSKLDIVDNSQNTALHYASQSGQRNIVTALLRAGAAPDKTNAAGSTAAHLAVAAGHATIVRSLASAGADFSTKDHAGWSVSMLAERSNKPRIKQFANNRPARRIVASASMSAAEQVMQAVRNDNNELLRNILRSSNATGNTATKALILAVELGHEECALTLLASGIDVNASEGLAGSLLTTSARRSSDQLIRAFLAKGAPIDAADDKQRTALHHAVIKGCTRCVKTLLQAGASPARQTQSGATPLILAAKRNAAEIGQALYAATPRPNSDSHGRSALWWATAKKATDFIVVALRHDRRFRVGQRWQEPVARGCRRPSRRYCLDTAAVRAKIRSISGKRRWHDAAHDSGVAKSRLGCTAVDRHRYCNRYGGQCGRYGADSGSKKQSTGDSNTVDQRRGFQPSSQRTTSKRREPDPGDE